MKCIISFSFQLKIDPCFCSLTSGTGNCLSREFVTLVNCDFSQENKKMPEVLSHLAFSLSATVFHASVKKE